MKKLYFTLIIGLILSSSTLISKAHALIIVDDASDMFTAGDFMFFGNNHASGTGQNYEVLKFSVRGAGTSGTAFDGSTFGGGFQDDQAPHGDVSIGDLWTHLNANGITSTTQLVFGFDVNQNDCTNDAGSTVDCIDITDLEITLDALTFSLGAETVRVFELNGEGSSTAEARIKIELGFDFMSTYSAASAETFRIQATHDGENAGFDEYFLSSSFISDNTLTTPEPLSMFLFGSGIAGMCLRRKKHS